MYWTDAMFWSSLPSFKLFASLWPLHFPSLFPSLLSFHPFRFSFLLSFSFTYLSFPEPLPLPIPPLPSSFLYYSIPSFFPFFPPRFSLPTVHMPKISRSRRKCTLFGPSPKPCSSSNGLLPIYPIPLFLMFSSSTTWTTAALMSSLFPLTRVFSRYNWK